MTVRDIATQYRVNPQVVYNVIKEFEIYGKIKLKRKARKLVFNEKAIKLIKEELERRGYEEEV